MEKKRALTKEDAEFLKDLQCEMNTQDTVGQASPRFWVLQDIKKVRTEKDCSSGWDISCDEDSKCASNFNEFVEYLSNCYFESDEVEVLSFDTDNYGCFSLELKNLVDKDGESTSLYSGYEIDELIETLELDGWIQDEYFTINWYHEQYETIQSTLFLTLKEAREHVNKYHYNYTDKVRTYAMTAYRSPQVETLYEILENVDFEKLIENRN